MTSFARKVLTESGKDLYYIKGIDNSGRTAWFKLELKVGFEKMFLKSIKDKVVLDLTQFGKIIDSGYR